MPDRSRKKPKDANQLAKRVVDQATRPAGGKEAKPEPTREKDPAAVSLGRRGGLKGGKARAEALSADARAEIARNAALSRWKRDS